jgi:carbonic anhydrase
MNNRNKFIFIISVAVCAYIAWSFVSIFNSNNKKNEFFTIFKKTPFVGKQYEALVVSCIDMTKEQRDAMNMYLTKKGYDDLHLKYTILSMDYDEKALYNIINKSIRNYNIQEIIIIGHMSCISMRKHLGLEKISEPKETRWVSRNLKNIRYKLTRRYRRRIVVSIKMLNMTNEMVDIE